MNDLSSLNPTPHAIAVYASQPLSPAATQHSLPSGRYSLLEPDLHRLDRTSFSWRTYSITSSARCWSCKGTSRPSALAVLARLRCGHPSSECPQKCEVSAPADYWPSRALIAASVQGFLLHDDWDDGW